MALSLTAISVAFLSTEPSLTVSTYRETFSMSEKLMLWMTLTDTLRLWVTSWVLTHRTMAKQSSLMSFASTMPLLNSRSMTDILSSWNSDSEIFSECLSISEPFRMYFCSWVRVSNQASWSCCCSLEFLELRKFGRTELMGDSSRTHQYFSWKIFSKKFN